jgi:glycosyltransferase involved in cell wall biosynthesis
VRVLVAANLDSQRPFGQFTRPFHLAAGLARAGVDVAVVGVDCERVDFGPAWSIGEQAARRMAGAIRTAERTFRPDVVYAHQNMPAAMALAVARAPVVADQHAVVSAEWAVYATDAGGRAAVRCRVRQLQALAIERLLMRRADRVIAAADQVADELVRRHGGRRPQVVVNGAEPELLELADTPPRPAAYEAPGKHAVATLAAASSPNNETALRFLAEAGRELAVRAPAVQLHVLGSDDGPAAPTLRYHGLVPSLVPWLHHADACLVPLPPSQGEFGGVRNKLLDALARGRLVVTTEEGLAGLEEAASWPGVVVAPGDPDGYARALAGALANGAAHTPVDRHVVRERLRWDVLAVQLRGCLEEVAARP